MEARRSVKVPIVPAPTTRRERTILVSPGSTDEQQGDLAKRPRTHFLLTTNKARGNL